MKDRLRGFALEQYNEMLAAIPHFDESWHVVTISDNSGNIEEFIGVGKTFNDAKPALRAGWKRLRKDYDENDFSVDLLVDGRLKSYVI
jgi:hypothetical protein